MKKIKNAGVGSFNNKRGGWLLLIANAADPISTNLPNGGHQQRRKEIAMATTLILQKIKNIKTKIPNSFRDFFIKVIPQYLK